MIYLADTNILLRFADRAHPLHPTVRAAVRKLRADGHRLRATLQNFVEFWNVATRSAERHGFGLTSVDADRLLLLSDSPAVYPEWRRLVVSFGVSGIRIHDARLVAALIVHGVTYILTFNTTDFARYTIYEKCRVVELTESGLLIASQLRQRYSLSFWDSTIVATALDAGVPVLYSENMQHGLTIGRSIGALGIRDMHD